MNDNVYLSLPVSLSPVRPVCRCRHWGGRTTSRVPGRGVRRRPGGCPWPGLSLPWVPWACGSVPVRVVSPGQAFPCWPDERFSATKDYRVAVVFRQRLTIQTHVRTLAVTRQISGRPDPQRYFRVARDHSGGSEINVALRGKYAVVGVLAQSARTAAARRGIDNI